MSIPTRYNGQTITADWFNAIKNEIESNSAETVFFKEYISDAAYALANTVKNGSVYYNTTAHKVRVYQDGAWIDLGTGSGGVITPVIETPTGNINGSNKDFIVSQTVVNDTVVVYVDGVKLSLTEYSFTSPTITLVKAPVLGQSVSVYYLSGGATSTTVTYEDTNNVEYYTILPANITSKSLTLNFTPVVGAKIMVDVIGGTTQEYGDDFIITGNVLDWNGLGMELILETNDSIRVQYFT